MVEEDKYCVGILTQVSAMTKALQTVALGLLEKQLAHRVINAVAEGGSEAEIKLKQASEAVARLVRSRSPTPRGRAANEHIQGRHPSRR